MREQAVKFKNINVSFTEQGKGKALVFLHGFLGAQTIWKPFVDKLSNTYRVITIDLLGHGNTACLSYLHSMEEMAEAVQAVLSHLKLRKYFFQLVRPVIGSGQSLYSVDKDEKKYIYQSQDQSELHSYHCLRLQSTQGRCFGGRKRLSAEIRLHRMQCS